MKTILSWIVGVLIVVGVVAFIVARVAIVLRDGTVSTAQDPYELGAPLPETVAPTSPPEYYLGVYDTCIYISGRLARSQKMDPADPEVAADIQQTCDDFTLSTMEAGWKEKRNGP